MTISVADTTRYDQDKIETLIVNLYKHDPDNINLQA
jgi:hypothetical protein